MRYTLIIGEKNYSSWSMRAWLLLKHLQFEFLEKTVNLYRPDSRSHVRRLGGQTGLVPVLFDGECPVWDTLAIFEHLAEQHGGVWPRALHDRCRARSLAGEVHSSFNALRYSMPVNTRARKRLARMTPEADADLSRIEAIWSFDSHTDGPWLLGEFSGVDIMFAPFATRFQTYEARLRPEAERYKQLLLTHPLVQEWLRLGELETNTIPMIEERGAARL